MPQPAVETSRRERRKQEFKDRILQAAITLFEADGCDATTLEAICEAADVSRPTFYKYFDCKQTLILALAETLWINVAQQFDEDFKQGTDTVDDYLAAFFGIVSAEFAKYGQLERELIRQSMNAGDSNPHYIGMLAALTDMFAGAFEHGQARGDLQVNYPIDFLAEMTMAAINNVMMRWATEDDYPIQTRLEQLPSFLPQMIRIGS